MSLPSYGKNNIAAGFLLMAGFMVYGFVLIYLRDFLPAKKSGLPSTRLELTLSHA